VGHQLAEILVGFGSNLDEIQNRGAEQRPGAGEAGAEIVEAGLKSGAVSGRCIDEVAKVAVVRRWRTAARCRVTMLAWLVTACIS